MKRSKDSNVLNFPGSDQIPQPPADYMDPFNEKDAEPQMYTMPLYGVKVPLTVNTEEDYKEFSKRMMEVLVNLSLNPGQYDLTEKSILAMMTISQIMLLPRIFNLEFLNYDIVEDFLDPFKRLHAITMYMYERGKEAGIFSDTDLSKFIEASLQGLHDPEED